MVRPVLAVAVAVALRPGNAGSNTATDHIAVDEHGPLFAVGVEGTSSYGLRICAALTHTGLTVVEVNRTRPAERRRQGKTDQLDAYRAARSVLSGEATTDPKIASIEPLRALQVARRSAVKAQQAAGRQLGALLVNAPPRIRDHYRDLRVVKLGPALANTRPGHVADPANADILAALRSLARRHRPSPRKSMHSRSA